MIDQHLYTEMKIWKRISEREAVRYAILHEPASNGYYLQSADFFRLPLDEAQMRAHDRQFVELFIETPIAERSQRFDSIEAAIAAASVAQDLDFS